MSRLFDALREANHFRQGADGNAGEGVWEALGIDPTQEKNGATVATSGVDAVPKAEPTEISALAALMAEELKTAAPEEVLAPDQERNPSTVAPPPGSIGITVHTALDANARLIPHAVNSIVVEHYRRLRTKILQQQEQKTFRSLVVTSPSPLEGKTVTVLNLGLSFAMLPSFRVLVVDGDLRRGTLGNWLGVDDERLGLSNLIEGSAQLEDVVLRSEEVPMHFIVRGNSQVPDLHSSMLNPHFQKMAEQFDLVLVDSPPVNLITDVQVLAGSCDAVVLVARAFSTTRKALEKAVQDLLPFRVIGTVLNAGKAQHSSGYYPY